MNTSILIVLTTNLIVSKIAATKFIIATDTDVDEEFISYYDNYICLIILSVLWSLTFQKIFSCCYILHYYDFLYCIHVSFSEIPE